jgi:uncharacterized protein (TIGR03790 family)
VKFALLLISLSVVLLSQTPENVLVVVNDNSLFSRRIADYYVQKRGVPLANVCHVRAPIDEEVPRKVFEQTIEAPVAGCLRAHGLQEKVLYLVTTLGLPLRSMAPGTTDMDTGTSAVDSELTLLYAKLHGQKFKLSGMVPNPFFRKQTATFKHPDFPIYLVTRLAGYDFEDVKGIIDRSLAAVNRGKFVLDLKSSSNEPGNSWLRAAAAALPKDRVVLDETDKVLYDQRDVIGYASWGSNDSNRKRRNVGFQWLPGAVATEFVSSDARTFTRPPDNWNITSWKDTAHHYSGSPQNLTADIIHEGATGCSGHVTEPYLMATPRPELLLPAYLSGRTLAESYYLAIPALSWQNIVIGDPLCRLKPR